MPPKSQNKPAEKPAKGGKPPKSGQSGSTGPTKPKAAAWWAFTFVCSAFAMAARELSEELSLRFGPGVSISHFERMIVEYSTLSPAQQKLVFLDERLISLFKKYIAAREARDAERESFRATKDVEAVGTALEKVLGIMGQDPAEAKEDTGQK